MKTVREHGVARSLAKMFFVDHRDPSELLLRVEVYGVRFKSARQ